MPTNPTFGYTRHLSKRLARWDAMLSRDRRGFSPGRRNIKTVCRGLRVDLHAKLGIGGGAYTFSFHSWIHHGWELPHQQPLAAKARFLGIAFQGCCMRSRRRSHMFFYHVCVGPMLQGWRHRLGLACGFTGLTRGNQLYIFSHSASFAQMPGPQPAANCVLRVYPTCGEPSTPRVGTRYPVAASVCPAAGRWPVKCELWAVGLRAIPPLPWHSLT